MKKLVASMPNAEVLGESILGYVQCVNQDEIEPILEAHNLLNVQADSWYPHQAILDVMRDIEAGTYNVSESLVSIGIKIMELATIPDSVNSIPAALEALGFVYKQHHRHVHERGWYILAAEPGHIQVVHDSPYPEDAAYGIVWGTVKRFCPGSSNYRITPLIEDDPDQPRVYDITWG
jgi:hypothetical protein